MTTKQIIFQGHPFDVPVWAKYVAKDDNGDVYAYEEEPIYDVMHQQWSVTDGDYQELGNMNLLKLSE